MANKCQWTHSLFLFVLLLSGGAVKGDPRTYTVGFAQDTMKNDWRAAQVKELEAALKPHRNIRFVFTDAEGDPTRQALDAERLSKQGVDFLVTSPRDPRIMTPVIDRIYKSGTPVILLTRKILSNNFTTFIAANDHEIARAAARHLVGELNGKGQVVMLQGVETASTVKARAAGFREELAKSPGIRIVAAPYANYLRGDAIREMEKIISRRLRFDAIYSHSDSMAVGARIAMQKAGMDARRVSIVGIDYIPEAREAIRRGEQSASFTYPTAGREGAQAIMQLIKGRKVSKVQYIPFTKVTRKNVDKIKTVFR